MKLIATTIRDLTAAPEEDDKVYFDERLAGFGLRVRKSGVHSWMIKYKFGGLTRRMVLGRLSGLDPGKAFETAKNLMAQVRLGRDPVTEKEIAHAQAAETFGVLLPQYLKHKHSELKPRSYVEVKRHLEVDAKPLHGLGVKTISRPVISALLAKVEERGPTARNRTRADLSGYFTWLAGEGHVDANPVSYTNTVVEKGERKHVPSDTDLRAIWFALEDDDYGTIVKLLILTGARRDEIGGLRWSEFDGASTITIPPARIKNRRAHMIPLSAPARAILDAIQRRDNADGTPCDHVFGRGASGYQGWSKSKAELDARIMAERDGKPLPHWVLHDFRRYLSTTLHQKPFSISPHVVEILLGHISGHKGGVAGVYNQAEYLDERRDALERWGAHIMELVTGKPERPPRGPTQSRAKLQRCSRPVAGVTALR
jgi:integrase